MRTQTLGKLKAKVTRRFQAFYNAKQHIVRERIKEHLVKVHKDGEHAFISVYHGCLVSFQKMCRRIKKELKKGSVT